MNWTMRKNGHYRAAIRGRMYRLAHVKEGWSVHYSLNGDDWHALGRGLTALDVAKLVAEYDHNQMEIEP